MDWVVETAADADGVAWTLVHPRRDDPPWCRFQLDGRGGLDGLFVSRSAGAVPKAIPFRVRIGDAETAAKRATGYAMLALCGLAGEEVRIETTDRVARPAADEQAIAESWSAFLSGEEAPAPAPEAADEALEIPREIYEGGLEGGRGVSSTQRGTLLLEMGPHYSVGRPLDGFAAAEAVSCGVRPEGAALPAGCDLDAARAALAAVRRPSSAAVSFYALASGERARLRKQAADALPVLAGAIAESATLSRAVDEMAPLRPLLEARTGLTKAAFRRLGKLRAAPPDGHLFGDGEAHGVDALGVDRTRRLRLDSFMGIDNALRCLSKLPPDRAPATDEDWTAYNAILGGCARPLSDLLGAPVEKILAAAKADWTGFADSLAAAAEHPPETFDQRAMALATADAVEAVEGFARALLGACLKADEEPPVAPDILRGAFRVAANAAVNKAGNIGGRAFTVARRYASRIPAIQTIEGRVASAPVADGPHYPDGGFPTLTNAWTAPNGLRLVPLDCASDFHDEADAMKHCIATYLRTAQRTACHIYSVRSPDGQRLSTLEISPIAGEEARFACDDIRIQQHKAKRNTPPTSAAKAAAKAFAKALRERSVAIRFDEIVEWRARPNLQCGEHSAASWASVLEYDWRNAERTQALLDEWRGVIGSGAVSEALAEAQRRRLGG